MRRARARHACNLVPCTAHGKTSRQAANCRSLAATKRGSARLSQFTDAGRGVRQAGCQWGVGVACGYSAYKAPGGGANRTWRRGDLEWCAEAAENCFPVAHHRHKHVEALFRKRRVRARATEREREGGREGGREIFTCLWPLPVLCLGAATFVLWGGGARLPGTPTPQAAARGRGKEVSACWCGAHRRDGERVVGKRWDLRDMVGPPAGNNTTD